MEAPNCYGCKHRVQLDWSDQSGCMARGAKVLGDWRGETRGQFNWPLNFNPVWLEMCDSYEEIPDDTED